jgi:4,5-DOPA dioxygenase extradiol
MTTAPSLFISHGSPMFALEPGELGPNLRDVGESLRGISAVLVVSPHWQTRGVRVGTSAAPETIHDFGGFPAPLYELQYRAPGAPALALDASRLLAAAGFDVTLDAQRGLDHGAWVPLRERGVLLVGSGSLTHNLYEFRQHISDPEYAQQFADWVRDAVAARDVDALVDYRRRAPHAQRAHPTEEHFLPLLVAAGASGDGEAVRLVAGGMTYGVLSMDSFAFGLKEAA